MDAELFRVVANWGFPALVAIYLLVRFEKTLERLGKQIELNTLILARSTGLDIEEERRRIVNGMGAP